MMATLARRIANTIPATDLMAYLAGQSGDDALCVDKVGLAKVVESV